MVPSNTQYDTEAKLLEEALKWLEPQRRDGIKTIRITDMSHKGYSDLFLSVNGWFVVAELKDKTGTASPHQIEFIKQMEMTGAIGGVCRSLKDIYDLIQRAKSKLKR